MITAYEKRIAKLEQEKLVMSERMENSGQLRHTFEESFELAMKFLTSHCNIGEKGTVRWKKTVLRLAFSEPVPYCRKEGLRTPQTALPFKALAAFTTEKCEMAHPSGFEPETSTFGG